MTKQQIIDAANVLSDAERRAHRLIIWGHFTKVKNPEDTAFDLLKSLKNPTVTKPYSCSWLRNKKGHKILGILIGFRLPEAAQDCLAHTSLIKAASKSVR